MVKFGAAPKLQAGGSDISLVIASESTMHPLACARAINICEPLDIDEVGIEIEKDLEKGLLGLVITAGPEATGLPSTSIVIVTGMLAGLTVTVPLIRTSKQVVLMSMIAGTPRRIIFTCTLLDRALSHVSLLAAAVIVCSPGVSVLVIIVNAPVTGSAVPKPISLLFSSKSTISTPGLAVPVTTAVSSLHDASAEIITGGIKILVLNILILLVRFATARH